MVQWTGIAEDSMFHLESRLLMSDTLFLHGRCDEKYDTLGDMDGMRAIRWDDVTERSDCDSGRPLGLPDFGLSACVIAMMTHCPSRRFTATLRNA